MKKHQRCLCLEDVETDNKGPRIFVWFLPSFLPSFHLFCFMPFVRPYCHSGNPFLQPLHAMNSAVRYRRMSQPKHDLWGISLKVPLEQSTGEQNKTDENPFGFQKVLIECNDSTWYHSIACFALLASKVLCHDYCHPLQYISYHMSCTISYC